jgi:hypothetical protein
MQTTDEPNYFGEILSILQTEELIRIRRRFELKHNARMAAIMTDEIIEREELNMQAALVLYPLLPDPYGSRKDQTI